MTKPDCNGPDCRRKVERQGLCWGHFRQKDRGKPLTPIQPKKSDLSLLVKAALELANADDNEKADAAFASLADRLRIQAMRYALKVLRKQGFYHPLMKSYDLATNAVHSTTKNPGEGSGKD